jgi:hypothetical protein
MSNETPKSEYQNPGLVRPRYREELSESTIHPGRRHSSSFEEFPEFLKQEISNFLMSLENFGFLNGTLISLRSLALALTLIW